jgi:hypothetical protein
MSFRAIRTAALLAVASFAFGTSFAHATALTITLDGTLGPVLKGDDPAHLDGDSAIVTVTASESLKPFKTSSKSASYHIPAGDVVVDVDGTEYKSTTRSTMTVKLGKTADYLDFNATLKIEGFSVKVSDVSALESGSWSSSVLEHPAEFSPSPQDLSEPASNFTYTVFGETTELGVTGTISNSDAAEQYNDIIPAQAGTR